MMPSATTALNAMCVGFDRCCEVFTVFLLIIYAQPYVLWRWAGVHP
jgi:hypothetical protein